MESASSARDDGGSLPFTGLDMALLVAAGGVLVAVGLGMRRLTRLRGQPRLAPRLDGEVHRS
jgi:hypothetical protein